MTQKDLLNRCLAQGSVVGPLVLPGDTVGINPVKERSVASLVGTLGDKGGVLKYTGTEWINTGGGLSGFWVPCLAYDSLHNMLYAGAGAGVADINHFGHSVWKYDGTNWTDTGGVVSSYSVNSLACDSARNTVYAGCFQDMGGKGVWKYDGASWTKISNEEMPNYRFRPLAHDSNSNLLYAGCMDEMVNGKGVWKYGGR